MSIGDLGRRGHRSGAWYGTVLASVSLGLLMLLSTSGLSLAADDANKGKKESAAKEVKPAAKAGPTLSSVLKAGTLKCGVSQGLAGFSNADAKNNWTGLDVDVCRAVAAAIFDDPTKVKFTPLSAKERFTALQSGEIDILSRNTTWTISRDTTLGLDFAGVTYYDGQGFLVRKASKIKSAKELDGATICVNAGTTTELNLADYFNFTKMKYKLVTFETSEETVSAYDAGRCDAYTTDKSGINTQLQKLKKPEDHLVLPETISKEPLGPAVRHGDQQWGDLVRWTLYVLVEAEELGVTKANVVELYKSSKNPVVRRLLGLDGNTGTSLGLDSKWSYQVVKHMGNYGEIFAANLPKEERGLNALWNQGGLQYAMPIR